MIFLASRDIYFHLEDRRHRQTMNQTFVTELGVFSLQLKRRRVLKSTESKSNLVNSETDQQVENVFEGTISLIPERGISRIKLSTAFLQKWTKHGYFSPQPTLSFCAIIPDDSRIFTLTSEGDLEGMINHIQQGHASLTDCDSKGRTLLNASQNNP